MAKNLRVCRTDDSEYSADRDSAGIPNGLYGALSGNLALRTTASDASGPLVIGAHGGWLRLVVGKLGYKFGQGCWSACADTKSYQLMVESGKKYAKFPLFLAAVCVRPLRSEDRDDPPASGRPVRRRRDRRTLRRHRRRRRRAAHGGSPSTTPTCHPVLVFTGGGTEREIEEKTPSPRCARRSTCG